MSSGFTQPAASDSRFYKTNQQNSMMHPFNTINISRRESVFLIYETRMPELNTPERWLSNRSGITFRAACISIILLRCEASRPVQFKGNKDRNMQFIIQITLLVSFEITQPLYMAYLELILNAHALDCENY